MMTKRLIIIVVVIASCKTQPGSNREYDKFDPNKTYSLKLNPVAGSSYHYDILNESQTGVELEDKKTGSETKTAIGVNFKISKDSSGDFLLNILYDKIHLYSKNGETETDADAANAAGTFNPIEKMLGILKDANITATVSPAGEIKDMSGYQELGDKIIASMAPDDFNGKEIAKAQWEKQIGDRLVRNSMDQLFKIFPDSSVHLNDNWKITSKQESDMGLQMKNTFTLKAINSDIAVISVRGKITNDNETANVLGMNNVKLDLNGEQEGEFEMETKTGMLINCSMKANVKGSIQVIDREVPIKIKTSVKIDGRRL
jgi:Family of unknown function (DUF6263)